MPLAHRRLRGLCGRALAIDLPANEPETERDKLCDECARSARRNGSNDGAMQTSSITAARGSELIIAAVRWLLIQRTPPLLVSVDGPSGSGKSTVAGACSRRAGCHNRAER